MKHNRGSLIVSAALGLVLFLVVIAVIANVAPRSKMPMMITELANRDHNQNIDSILFAMYHSDYVNKIDVSYDSNIEVTSDNGRYYFVDISQGKIPADTELVTNYTTNGKHLLGTLNYRKQEMDVLVQQKDYPIKEYKEVIVDGKTLFIPNTDNYETITLKEYKYGQ